jgi:hypothetical protein
MVGTAGHILQELQYVADLRFVRCEPCLSLRGIELRQRKVHSTDDARRIIGKRLFPRVDCQDD